MEIRVVEIRLFYHGGIMEKITRPQKVSKQESIIRNQENNQEYVQRQIEDIYNYLDKIAQKITELGK